MYLDEEGKLKGLPLNPLASILYGHPTDRIVGDVVVVGPPDVNGDDTDIRDSDLEWIGRCLTSLSEQIRLLRRAVRLGP